MIDDRILQPWPPEVTDRLGQLRQGHLLPDPPFFYFGDPRHPLWEGTRALGGNTPDLVALAAADQPEFGIILTQTCDLDESDRAVARMPWIQLAPVYPLRPADLPDEFRRDLEADSRLDLVRLAPPTLDPGVLWVGDLRIDIPVEKGWLVGRGPIEAFPDDAGYERLAERLQERAARPAYASNVSAMIRRLRLRFNHLGRTGAVRQGVAQLRMNIRPSRLEADTAGLIVIQSLDAKAEVERWFDNWAENERTVSAAAGLDLLPVRYTTMDDMSAADYARADHLTFRERGAN